LRVQGTHTSGRPSPGVHVLKAQRLVYHSTLGLKLIKKKKKKAYLRAERRLLEEAEHALARLNLGFGFQISGSRFRVWGFGFRVSDFGFQVSGLTEAGFAGAAAVACACTAACAALPAASVARSTCSMAPKSSRGGPAPPAHTGKPSQVTSLHLRLRACAHGQALSEQWVQRHPEAGFSYTRWPAPPAHIRDTVRAPYNTTSGRDCVKSPRLALRAMAPTSSRGGLLLHWSHCSERVELHLSLRLLQVLVQFRRAFLHLKKKKRLGIRDQGLGVRSWGLMISHSGLGTRDEGFGVGGWGFLHLLARGLHLVDRLLQRRHRPLPCVCV